jgi:transposase-like protein
LEKESSMKNDVFNTAKKLKDEYDKLYEYRRKLQHAKGCGLSRVHLEVYVGISNSPLELYFKNMDLMREAIEKEIELVTVELDQLQEQFDNL